MRVACADPITVAAQDIRDIRDNSLARKSAYEKCALKMGTLLEWLNDAEKLQAADAKKQASPKQK